VAIDVPQDTEGEASGAAEEMEKSQQWERDPDGCSKEILWIERQAHESMCMFAPAHCPNCEQSGMRKWQLEEHLLHCDSAPCPHQQFGCDFHGTLSTMPGHLVTCTYEKLKGYLGKQHLELQELKVGECVAV
jgi:hypothetical protein